MATPTFRTFSYKGEVDKADPDRNKPEEETYQFSNNREFKRRKSQPSSFYQDS